LVEFSFRVLETAFDASDRIFVNANAIRQIKIRLKKNTTEKNPGKKPSGLLARREQFVNTIQFKPLRLVWLLPYASELPCYGYGLRPYQGRVLVFVIVRGP